MRVSIAICTDGRRDSLQRTLESLRQLDARDFEVCVVCGPTQDGTRDLVETWPDPLKIANCPARNLSMARNIAIELSAGDIVAFLDDDSIPEPEWLGQIVAAYEDPKVGGAGGFVHDHTGVAYQWRFGTTNRLGRANLEWSRSAEEFNFPYTANFPHLLGANSSFRRTALISVGGFDEEFEYYLDETDLAARIIDDGWKIAQISGAYVHHKYLPSSIRNESRVLKSWYSVIKNKIYYSMVHRSGYHSIAEAINDAQDMISNFERELAWAISQRYLARADRARFHADVKRAWQDGLVRGLSEAPRALMSPSRRAAPPPPYKPYLAACGPGPKKTYCIITQEYPPAQVGGVGRYFHQLAKDLAAMGRQVHVLTLGADHDRLDLEDGVWTHRLLPREAPPAPITAGGPVPDHIWRWAWTLLKRIEEIAERRPIDCVYAPIWDCEGAAVLGDAQVPLVIGLQTTLRMWLRSHPEKRDDETFVKQFLHPMAALEAEVLGRADRLHAISSAIVDEIRREYGLDVGGRSRVIPLGLEDYALAPRKPPPTAAPGVRLRVLFVGRLEPRKGIDVLLEAAALTLTRRPDVQLDIVGDDSIVLDGGFTARQSFGRLGIDAQVKRRIVFHGPAPDEALRGFYAGCDIFVAPSRFESFGLVFVEAMMFAKPVIGARAGGIPEVVADGECGLLAAPGDPVSLAACLERLIDDSDLRQRMGQAGRARYETCFSSLRMTSAVAELMDEAAQAHRLKAAQTSGSAEL